MSLAPLGVSATEETVYRGLIARPAASVADLVTELRFPADEIAAAVTALLDRGLLGTDPAAPSGVHVRQPGIALPALAVRQAEELAHRLSAIARAQAEATAFDDLFAEREGSDATRAGPGGRAVGTGDVEVLTGRSEVQGVLEGLAQSSRRSLDSVTTVSRGNDMLREPMLMRSVHRGLRVRWIVRARVLQEPAERALIENSIRGGVEMRVSTADDLYRLVIVDASLALVPRDVQDLSAGALLVRHPVLLSALQDTFDRLWSAAAPLAVRSGRLVDPPLLTLDGQDRHLLDALATHGTDEAAARALSVSERQLRRRIAKAVTALDARNRFHAGALAARHGLLAPDPTSSGHDRSAGTGRPDSSVST